MTRSCLLFNGVSIYDVIEGQKKGVEEGVQELDANYLLNVSEEDLIACLVNQFRLDVPVLNEEGISVESGEAQVDVSRDPMRFIDDRSRPFYLPGSRTTIIIPFDGAPGLLGVRPSTFTTTLPVADVTGHQILLTYESAEANAEAIKHEYGRTVQEIKTNLRWLSESVDPFNRGLESLVRQKVAERKTRLLAHAGMVAALGLPMRKRGGVPTTYAVPVARRKPIIERPKASAAPFQPEPALAQEEWENILSIIKNMVAVMERSPGAFESMGEEDLRTHFLVQLNGQYEGQATGETFNSQGKTDILIRAEGRNVFISECKFWRGRKELLAAIDQVLSYLAWRDTKAAVLVFNRNVNFTDVLSEIASTACAHKCFKRALGQKDETDFRYLFHQPDDANREVHLAILAFNVPRVGAKTQEAGERGR